MEWISVKDQLPEGECIAIGYQNEVMIGYINETVGWIQCENDHEVLTHVTHWMPLPEPPKL